MKPILRYAKKLTLSPTRMSEADAASVLRSWMGGRCALFDSAGDGAVDFYNRLVDGVGLALPEGYVAEAANGFRPWDTTSSPRSLSRETHPYEPLRVCNHDRRTQLFA